MAHRRTPAAQQQGFTAEHARAAAAAAASPCTPQAILTAFFPPDLRLADLRIQPISLATFMALERIGSPLAAIGSDTPATISAEDIARALILLTLPCHEPADLARIRHLAAAPADLDELAWTLASRIPLADLIQIGPMLRQRMEEAFATALPTRAPSQAGETGASDGPFPPSQPEAPPSAGR